MRGAYFAQGRYVLRLASMLFPERALELSHSVVNKTKAISCLIVFICSALVALAAPASTPRLGIVVEDAAFNAVSDVLTVELSGKPGVQLVERAEIDKVYREQKLSAASRDYLKLGQVLGADGLLILQRQNEDTNQFIAIRHIAVKPGVILSANRFAWPMTNVTEWASFYAKQIEPQFPKLGVSARDAVPLSIVHIRSAIASAEVKDTEAQLKLLLIERLSREPQFFVLERQRLQLLGEEKDLQADDSAFWSGAWLVDGTVDQAGYSKDRITIDARLAPPKGSGSPVHFQIAGSRTDLPEVINRVALKIGESLKVAVVSEWRPEDEAEQYLANAKWALRWGLYREAQSAADSAWALGRKDVDCATARLKAYLGELNEAIPKLSFCEALLTKSPPSYIESYITKEIAGLPFGGIYSYKKTSSTNTIALHFAWSEVRPDPANIARAKHVVGLYYHFARSSPKAAPVVRVYLNSYRHIEWDDLGVETLISASKVIQHFNLFARPEDQPSTELAELRELVRTVADFISTTPAVHNSYFVGERLTGRDELINRINKGPNIFLCKVNWGCFWQERPEDAIALYRDLMSSPAFCYLHDAFWERSVTMPRVVAWNERDKQRIPALWTAFTNSLHASTNILLQMEAKALERADGLTEEQAHPAAESVRVFVTNAPSLRPGSSNAPCVPTPASRVAASEVVSNIIVVHQVHAFPAVHASTNFYYPIGITAHHLQENKLILDMWYATYHMEVDPSDKTGRTSQSTESAVGIFDLQKKKWELFTCPPAERTRRNRFYNRTVLAHGKLYTSDGGRILKYDTYNQCWQDLDIPSSGNCELFFANDRLFAANSNTIFEITDEGRSSRIIASNRRQPPVSFLDSEDLGNPALFEGPGRSVRLAAATKIFDALGEDWRHVANLPFTTRPSVFAPDGVLFRSAGNICFLPRNATNVLVCLAAKPRQGLVQRGFPFQRPPHQLSTSQEPAPKPLWDLPADPELRNSVFTVRSSSLYALVDRSESQDIVDTKRNAIIGSRTLARDGYHAELLCFSPGSATPSKRFLKFEAPDARLPVSGSSVGSRSVPVMGSPSWIAFSSQYLIIGDEALFNIPLAGSTPFSRGQKRGIWLMPLSEIDDAPPVHASNK